MDTFAKCHVINNFLCSGDEAKAREEVIKLLAHLEDSSEDYSPLINRLIRNVGLFPYLDTNTSNWEERFVHEAFKSDIGGKSSITLHREQSRLLNALLSGKSIAVSAPTSFGKSFVIDSFISIRQPTNVVILVPTIALGDETRRRLQHKFGNKYKIITTAGQRLAERNILVFPQERVLGYIDALEHIDILIVDEFYKASEAFDKERSPALIRSIIGLSKKADQRYFLAPNIDELRESIFTEGMDFLHLDFHTVFLDIDERYKEVGRDKERKSEVLLDILKNNQGKSLIYAGTYSNISSLSTLLIDKLLPSNSTLLEDFRSWLATNYDPNWELTKLISRGVGIHNGQLHRSLSQIQIRLFDDMNGIDRLISTSSIIEGVNTSAQNVILWSNKNGKFKINDFTYKNIIGRGGRMFKHFVGKIFVLEEPPQEASNQLKLDMPEKLLGQIDEKSFDYEYSQEQVSAIRAYEEEMIKLVGKDNLEYFRQTDTIHSCDTELVVNIARSIQDDGGDWNGLKFLNSPIPNSWERLLYKLIKLRPNIWETTWSKYVGFVKILSKNWNRSIPELLDDLGAYDLGIDDFFKLERNTTFKLATLLGDVCTIYNRINPDNQVDLTPALSRISHAFLPPVVYQLEEYGIPRMISRKLQSSGLFDFEDKELNIHVAIEEFQNLGIDYLTSKVHDLSSFDAYIIRHFFEGIASIG